MTACIASKARLQLHPATEGSVACKTMIGQQPKLSCVAHRGEIGSVAAAHHVNNMKGSIYMVFDYMDHDLTGLMERRGYKMEVSHVRVP